MWNVSTILLPFCSDWLNSLLKNLKVKENINLMGSILLRACLPFLHTPHAHRRMLLPSHANINKKQQSKLQEEKNSFSTTFIAYFNIENLKLYSQNKPNLMSSFRSQKLFYLHCHEEKRFELKRKTKDENLSGKSN